VVYGAEVRRRALVSVGVSPGVRVDDSRLLGEPGRFGVLLAAGGAVPVTAVRGACRSWSSGAGPAEYARHRQFVRPIVSFHAVPSASPTPTPTSRRSG